MNLLKFHNFIQNILILFKFFLPPIKFEKHILTIITLVKLNSKISYWNKMNNGIKYGHIIKALFKLFSCFLITFPLEIF
jgi:hypothetical protein